MTVRRAVVAGLAALAAIRAAAAHGAPVTAGGGVVAVRAAAADCAAAPLYPAFLDDLRVELAAGPLRCCAAAPAAAAAVVATVEACDAASADVMVVDAGASAGTPGRGARRHIALGDVPADARPRALALAVAELVRAAAGAPPAVPAPDAVAVDRPAAAGGGRPRATATVDGTLRFYPAHPTTLAGGRLALALGGERWQARLDGGAEAGRASVDGGRIVTRAAGVGVAAGPRFRRGAVTLDLGAGGEVAWARIAGEATAGGVAADARSALVASAGVQLRAEAPAGRALRLQARLQLGETLRGLIGAADGRPTAGISGPFVLLGLGLGLF
jgi:hypothetical protein